MTWLFQCQLRGKPVVVEGMSHLDFAEDGRVIYQRDFWDASDLVVQLPVIGKFMRYIKTRLAAPQPSHQNRETK